jgi:hypothetical protein
MKTVIWDGCVKARANVLMIVLKASTSFKKKDLNKEVNEGLVDMATGKADARSNQFEVAKAEYAGNTSTFLNEFPRNGRTSTLYPTGSMGRITRISEDVIHGDPSIWSALMENLGLISPFHSHNRARSKIQFTQNCVGRTAINTSHCPVLTSFIFSPALYHTVPSSAAMDVCLSNLAIGGSAGHL